ncbi:MAG: imidazole glycerol phosphate synthase subunit HisH [Proteobacteria bacterium]|nr:imidazole glycerol phosphate synthase subunit HisH [Pseudomonadota bacterium]
MTTIAVVDCGMGNLHSVLAGVRRTQTTGEVIIATTAAAIHTADKIIFPGDGNFAACMQAIDAGGLRQALITAAQEKPFFGICVGMQVLFSGSAEANVPGLGIFAATVERLPQQATIKVPHMGWNTGRQQHPHTLTADIKDEEYFYFVHSYYAPLGDWTIMTCDYGVRFTAALAYENLVATQFHPEKSGKSGIRLLENFLNG